MSTHEDRAGRALRRPPDEREAQTFALQPDDLPGVGLLLQQVLVELTGIRRQLAGWIAGHEPASRAGQHWEYLSLFAARERGDGEFSIQTGRRGSGRLEETEALRQLGAAGWQLVAVVPARYDGDEISHQLYLRRPTGDLS